MSIFRELQRRNVVRAVIAYIVGGFLFVEGMDIVTGTFESPDWVMKVVIGLVFIGVFPVAVFSWIYEVTPEGVKREVENGPSHLPGNQRKMDVAIVVMLAVAIGLLVLDRTGGNPAVEDIAGEQAAAETIENDLPPMVAVLPFVSSALDGESAFFAEGIHDDLLTQLAQLQSLRVISRTSVMEYQDTTMNIRDIGAALGADAILEGRVQFAGGQIRLNAQLIDAKTDEHLWAHTYDRALSAESIFDLQTELAKAIATALRATLTMQDTEQLALMPTENMAAYRAYHRAMEIRDGPGPYDAAAFTLALEEAVELDPTFTRALAELAGAYAFRAFGSMDPEMISLSEVTLEKVRQLAPQSAEYLIAQSFYTYYVLKDYDRALLLITEAKKLAPSDVRLLELMAWILRRNHNLEAKVEVNREARSLDPRNPRWPENIVRDLMMLHQYDQARVEIDGVSMTSYRLEMLDAMLRVIEGAAPGELADTMERLYLSYPSVDPMELWDAYVADRNYVAAQAMVDDETTAWRNIGGLTLSGGQWAALMTAWMRDDQSALDTLLVRFEEMEESLGPLDGALVAALRGDQASTSHHIRQWERLAETDYAEVITKTHMVCRVLGVSAAASAAVDCLRNGLVVPSFVAPVLEPALPYYDSVRDSEAFVALSKELGAR